MMFTFFDQGKQEGYIREDISNDLLTLYLEIFQAGLKEKSEDIRNLSDNKAIEELINLYFFGVINK